MDSRAAAAGRGPGAPIFDGSREKEEREPLAMLYLNDTEKTSFSSF